MKVQIHLRTLPEGEMFQTKVKKIKTRFTLSIYFFSKLCRYEVMWRNMIKMII